MTPDEIAGVAEKLVGEVQKAAAPQTRLGHALVFALVCIGAEKLFVIGRGLGWW